MPATARRQGRPRKGAKPEKANKTTSFKLSPQEIATLDALADYLSGERKIRHTRTDALRVVLEESAEKRGLRQGK